MVQKTSIPFEDMRECLQKYAILQIPIACFALGFLFASQFFSVRDHPGGSRAILDELIAASAIWYGEAHKFSSFELEPLREVIRNWHQYVLYFRVIFEAKREISHALCDIGWCRENGLGVDRDSRAALVLYLRAWENGSIRGQKLAGDSYFFQNVGLHDLNLRGLKSLGILRNLPPTIPSEWAFRGHKFTEKQIKLLGKLLEKNPRPWCLRNIDFRDVCFEIFSSYSGETSFSDHCEQDCSEVRPMPFKGNVFRDIIREDSVYRNSNFENDTENEELPNSLSEQSSIEVIFRSEGQNIEMRDVVKRRGIDVKLLFPLLQLCAPTLQSFLISKPIGWSRSADLDIALWARVLSCRDGHLSFRGANVTDDGMLVLDTTILPWSSIVTVDCNCNPKLTRIPPFLRHCDPEHIAQVLIQVDTNLSSELRRVARLPAHSLVRLLRSFQMSPYLDLAHIQNLTDDVANLIQFVRPEKEYWGSLTHIDIRNNSLRCLPVFISFLSIEKVKQLMTNCGDDVTPHHLIEIMQRVAFPANMEFLDLSSLNLTDRIASALPIQYLIQLGALSAIQEIDVTGNPRLTLIPSSFGYFSSDTSSVRDPIQRISVDESCVRGLEGRYYRESESKGDYALLLNFLRLLHAEGEEALVPELKLMVIGASHAGKTSLIRRLRGDEFVLSQPRTDGIDLGTLNFPNCNDILFHTCLFLFFHLSHHFRYSSRLFLHSRTCERNLFFF
jgi:hypothetical protein